METAFFCDAEYEFLNTIYMDFMLQRVKKGKKVRKSLRMWRGLAFVSFSTASLIDLKHGILSQNTFLMFPLNRFLVIQI
jgi:hypothetical protein